MVDLAPTAPAAAAPASASPLDELLGLSAAAGEPMRRSWWRIARGGSTRFLIPTHRTGVRTALQMVNGRWNYWALRLGLAAARFTSRVPRVGTTLESIPLDELMAELFPGRRLEYAVYCGTESVYRKYTVQCQDASGRAVAYVKIGEAPRARASLLHESAVLRRIARSSTLRRAVPEVLHLVERWGCSVLVLSSLGAGGSRAPAVPSEPVRRFLVELFGVERTDVGWPGSPARERAVAAAAGLERAGEPEAAELLRLALAALDRAFGDHDLPHGRAHGDFLPWNVRLAPEPYVFDWEWSRMALPFHDLYHYLIFPRLGRTRRGSAGGLHRRARSARVRWLVARAAPDGLPFPADDVRWWQAYLTDAFAFYAEGATASGQRLQESGLIANLSELLRLALAERR